MISSLQSTRISELKIHPDYIDSKVGEKKNFAAFLLIELIFSSRLSLTIFNIMPTGKARN